MMDDFSFRGRHISEFGAVAAFGEAMRTGAKIRRGEYALPGGGSVEIGEGTWEPTTRQVSITPADGVNADERWRRRLLAWLQGGRGEMIVDNDASVVRIAQFDADGTYGTRGWPLGMLTMNMTLQPLAYDVLPTQTAARTSGGKAALALSLGEGLETPLRICLRCLSGTITRAEISAGGKTLVLGDPDLGAGGEIEYDAGEFLGDVMSLKKDGAVTFAPVSGGRWARLACLPGELIRVTLTGGEAQVTVTARGRYPA